MWEREQILRNTKDTNLGDFIIKLPNPDCLPENKQQQNQVDFANISDSLAIYDIMFDTEELSDKKSEKY